MGTLTSFFGGSGGGSTAIPNITYDLIRKATYKSKFQITGNENPVLIPLSDTTFVAFEGGAGSGLTAGHYTINDDGSVTTDQAQTSLSLNARCYGGVGNSNGDILIASQTSSNERFDHINWDGSSFTLTNVTDRSNGELRHICGTSLFNGYLIAAMAETNSTDMYVAVVDPNGTSSQSAFTSQMKYGQNREVACTGTADGIVFMGRSSEGQFSTVYKIGQQYIHLGSLSGGNVTVGSSSRTTNTNNTTFSQVYEIAVHPMRIGGAFWLASDGNNRIAKGTVFSDGMSFDYSTAGTSPMQQTSYAKAYFTQSNYGNWRQYNGTVMDAQYGALLQIDENNGSAMPLGLSKTGINDRDGLSINDGTSRTIQCGKYMIKAYRTTTNIIANVYEIE